MKTYGVIMAGGGGTRFWPLSRQKKPKQFLNLSGKDTMVMDTVNRLLKIANPEDIFIVTNKMHQQSTIELTKSVLKSDHILGEPDARNTAACIGYAAMEIVKKYEEIGRPSQVSLIIGEDIADLKILVDYFMPKPSIDKASIRMNELLNQRYSTHHKNEPVETDFADIIGGGE